MPAKTLKSRCRCNQKGAHIHAHELRLISKVMAKNLAGVALPVVPVLAQQPGELGWRSCWRPAGFPLSGPCQLPGAPVLARHLYPGEPPAWLAGRYSMPVPATWSGPAHTQPSHRITFHHRPEGKLLGQGPHVDEMRGSRDCSVYAHGAVYVAATHVLTSAAEGCRGFTVGRSASTLVAPGIAPPLPFCDGAGLGFGLPPVLLHQTSQFSLHTADAL